jgi:hypothetical protein
MIFNLSDLDLIFLSYDEQQDDHWYRVKQYKPNAKRIHAVKGFDRAHKLCAEIADTSRFIIVDGDNWLHDNLFDGTYDNISIDDTGVETACFSFSSVNVINGLSYGNGGVKVWHKETLLNTNTHEAANSTDFCWDIPYYQDSRILSVTVQNNLPMNAWRAGYREAIKMTFDNGNPRPNLSASWHLIHDKNLSRLNVWLAVGRDTVNGIWAMLGARQALYELLNDQVDHMLINDYDWFATKWVDSCLDMNNYGPDTSAHFYREHLQNLYNFYVPELDPKQSKWFKQTYINPLRAGLMR